MDDGCLHAVVWACRGLAWTERQQANTKANISKTGKGTVNGEYIGEPIKEETYEEKTGKGSDGKESQFSPSSANNLDGVVHGESTPRAYELRKEIYFVYAVWFVLVALGFGFNGPNELFMEPFYTGCDLYYSTEVADLASSYSSGGGKNTDQRLDDSMCAQFCIPCVASRFAQLGVNKLGIAAARGRCQDVGYEEHVADKTFAYLAYSLDVEIYYNTCP